MFGKLTSFIKEVTGVAGKERDAEQVVTDAAEKETARVAKIQETQDMLAAISPEKQAENQAKLEDSLSIKDLNEIQSAKWKDDAPQKADDNVWSAQHTNGQDIMGKKSNDIGMGGR